MKSHVILVVFDGCRPDGLAQAHTPTLDTLWQTGTYTWTARSVAPSYTLPTHTSMFRGVSPRAHGVNGNTFQASASAFPSIFDLAHQAGLHTAMFYSWEELRDLAAPGSLNLSYFRAIRFTEDTDQVIAGVAASYLVTEQPHLAFVYFHATDTIGHVSGWMSPPYLEAIEDMDRALGILVAALDQSGLRERFTLLVLADHGGHAHEHGTDQDDDLTIPWLINGPGIKRGHPTQAPVRIMDTAATIAHLLDLPRPESWEGQAVLDAFL
ncbi:MAG: alkaline phosphatase family protein, partial [Anaerolineae bacterium]|nr:alkaline phosphatase family protein [Anaerolineae bacterium]